MRQISFSILALLAGFSTGTAEVLVNTRLYPTEVIAKETTFQLDLRDYFQLYADPGPVATFELYMPVQAGFKELNEADGSLSEVTENTPDDLLYMTYELTSGESYTNAFDASPADFVWNTHTLQYQLLASEAPGTVANFMTYVTDGAYEETIVHRSEVEVVQAGGWQLSTSEEYILKLTEIRDPIAFESTRSNTQGTLAMARASFLDTATSQFFINLQDNSGTFGAAYAVFGELLEPETSLPLILQMGDVFTYNLTQFLRTTPFTATPLYTPGWEDKGSYVRFPSITVPSGNPDGVAHSYEVLDLDGVEGTTDEEAANQAVFNISIDGSILNVSRTDTGSSRIGVTGTAGDESRTFEIFLIAYNPEALEAFPTSFIYQEGWIDNSWFDWLVADDFPYIRHLNHGEGTGNGFDEDRTFYNYSTGEDITG
jgi:cyclophilin family peptidyl-prolyl cis-trans isomerase